MAQSTTERYSALFDQGRTRLTEWLDDVADEDLDRDRTDYDAAKDLILDPEKEYQGVIYQDENSIGYEKREGVEAPMTDIPDGAPEDAMDLVRAFC